MWRKGRGKGAPWLLAGAKAAFSVGANPTRQLSLQPEAIGAVMEVTKWLKPLVTASGDPVDVETESWLVY